MREETSRENHIMSGHIQTSMSFTAGMEVSNAGGKRAVGLIVVWASSSFSLFRVDGVVCEERHPVKVS